MSLWCSEYGMGVWAAMPMRATHMGLTCVAPSAPATESQRNVACLLKSIHPGLPRCDWVYRGGGGGAWRENRHGGCSFVPQYRRERGRCGGGDYVQRGGLWIATSLLPCSLLYSGRHNYGSYHVNVKLVAWNEDSVAAAQSLTRPLTTADITESPCQHLAVNYLETTPSLR